jgi:hypothetical protein
MNASEKTYFQCMQEAYEKIHNTSKAIETNESQANMDKLKLRVFAYMNVYANAVAANAIVADPYGIASCKTGCSFTKKFVRQYVKETKGKINDGDLSLLKERIMSSSDRISGKFSNGVKYLYDKASGSLVLSYKFTKKCISICTETISECWKFICTQIKALFSKGEDCNDSTKQVAVAAA